MSELPVPKKQSVDLLEFGTKLFAIFLAELWLYDRHREHSATFRGAPIYEALWFQVASIVAAIAYPITIAKFK